ncbi:DNA/RNA non-specific endonuclease [Paenarthrobacter sp. NPDC056912]|uniref:DNA/RNA non-specific endonuclease n=1 Tax=Paenarthrobacter sp. NPDC056912 TaxID=3345965 RepID=UPI00366DFDBB
MSVDFRDVCAAGGGASGISVEGLPPLPDPEALDTHARALAASGDAVHSGVNDAARSWAGLSGAYEAPEAGQVLAGFNPVLSRSQDLAALTGKAAAVLGAYADRARELKQRITALRADIVALDGLIGGNDDWQSHLNIVDRHRETMDKASALAQAILDSDAACATELSALTGGERYNAPAIPRATLDGSTDLIANGLTHAQHFFGTDQDLPDLPWGPPNVSLRLGGPGSAGQGFVSALLGAGQGLHTLLGTTDKVKQTQAWQGMFALGAAAVTTKAVIDRGFRDTTAEDLDAVLTVGGALKETIHYDDWATDPWHAAGATGFDVASLLAGGTGAGIKAGSTAGKLGLTAERLSIATMDSSRLGGLSSALSNAANGLHRTGLFLDKPGTLALKLSDLMMPATTTKVLDGITQAKVNMWAALLDAKTGAADVMGGAKHATADGMNHIAQGLRNAEASLPTTLHPDPSGVLSRTAGNSALPNWLDHTAAGIRENTPHAQGGSGPHLENRTSASPPTVTPDPFPPQNNITNTVVLQHGHDVFPVSRKDNFAARTGLHPNTEYIIDHRTKMKDGAGGHTANTMEKFYTDATGRVERVDTYAGIKGAWSTELNKRVPNVTYNVVAKADGGLENHFTIITDEFAKPKSVQAHITGLLKGDINRSAWQQILAGRRVGGSGYDGGHLIASLFAGPGEGANLLAQLMFQNRGHGIPNVPANTLAFYQLERDLMTKALHRVDTGQPLDLHLKVEAIPGPNPGLPSGLKVSHSFDEDLIQDDFFPNLEFPK